MSEEELFKLTPIRPEFVGKKIKGFLYSFGGYTSPDGENRLGTRYLQDRITIQQNNVSISVKSFKCITITFIQDMMYFLPSKKTSSRPNAVKASR